MNFESLKSSLHCKQTVNWSVEDVQTWLSYIQLENVKEYFSKYY